jgi:RNA-directed DNA polymerase
MVVEYRNGNLKSARSIQYALIKSFEGRALAVKNVSINQRFSTPGVDKILWDSPYLKVKAIRELRTAVLMSKKYEASKIKRV